MIFWRAFICKDWLLQIKEYLVLGLTGFPPAVTEQHFHALIFYNNLIQNIITTSYLHSNCLSYVPGTSVTPRKLQHVTKLPCNIISNSFLSHQRWMWNCRVLSPPRGESLYCRGIRYEALLQIKPFFSHSLCPFVYCLPAALHSSQGWERRLRLSFCLAISSLWKTQRERGQEYWHHTPLYKKKSHPYEHPSIGEIWMSAHTIIRPQRQLRFQHLSHALLVRHSSTPTLTFGLSSKLKVPLPVLGCFHTELWVKKKAKNVLVLYFSIYYIIGFYFKKGEKKKVVGVVYSCKIYHINMYRSHAAG